MLAYSIAKELGRGDVVKVVVKSTSRARDLLYRVDTLRRLHDAQDRENKTARLVYPYISLEPLGEALRDGKRQVILIDEIDKADIDFPNDLLDVLDTFTFQIPELPRGDEERACLQENKFGRQVTCPAEGRPIVVITSNREKRLPEPFLRRCLYVRLPFPDAEDDLCDIVRKNTRLSTKQLTGRVLRTAVKVFKQVRATAHGSTQKPPSTSELIDWVRILEWKGETVKSLEKDPLRPPYWETLFKTATDLDSYEARVTGGGA